jgi:arylsulfatase A-like enzyme
MLRLLLPVILGGLLPPALADNPRRPNILLIISDDQGWNDYGFMGNKQVRTPHLDRLASESLVFARGYTPVPLCRPSLATMITGLYPHRHGVTGNDPVLPGKRVNPMNGRSNPELRPFYEALVASFASRPNLVRDLTSRGYVSLQTGKWWEGDPVASTGFTHAMTKGTGKNDRHGGAGLGIGREGLKPITDFIHSAGDKPWLVWYAPMLPHTPHNPPDRLLEKYRASKASDAMARYLACVEWFDETCGELLRFLEAGNLRKDTVILYTCDNGWIQDPARIDKQAPRSKRSPYEGGVRTPIMVSWPGKVAPRMETVCLAGTIDIWPTLAGLLGTPVPDGLPGIDLTAPGAAEARKSLFGADFEHDVADVAKPARSLRHRWMIEGEWKLIVPDPTRLPGRTAELYSVRGDPWERKNLAADEPQRVSRMKGLLDMWWNPAESR